MDSKKPTVLVVDDTEATRYAISRTLINAGYETIEAATGTAALELVIQVNPDLVTLDIHLPDILGFEVCRRIKANPQTAHIPVLQVSASYITSTDRVHGLEGGADSYLTHPFEPAVLLATVKALIRTRVLNEELRTSEDRFRIALKSTPIMIYACDLNLRYTWMHNPPFPFTVEDFIGKTDSEIFSDVDALNLMELKRRALSVRSLVQSSIELEFGEVRRIYDITLEPLRHITGRIEGVSVACIDVTERERIAEKLRKATEEADLANQAKSRFLSNMSHEIRTPLGVIQGFADLALDHDLSEEDRNEFLITIKRNASNLTKLLGEILDLSKIEAGRVEFESVRFDLLEMVSEVVSAFGLQAHDKGVDLKFELQGRFPKMVTSDSTRIRQVLINLLSNAVKFTQSGGVIVSIRLAQGETAATSMVELKVKDTGIGLNPEQQSRMFQLFSQADNSTTRKFGGSGLGLNLSRKLAQALEGDVVLVESQLGKGSTFVFTFSPGDVSHEEFVDSLQVPTNRTPSRVNTGATNLKGLRVLLVEDSPDNQMLVSRYLEQSGALVDVASDGIDGVDLAKQKNYDVILMDIQMPRLDGYQATASLRAAGIMIPIIALTAHAIKEERDQALTRGFTQYLVKPLEPNRMLETLKHFMPTNPSV